MICEVETMIFVQLVAFVEIPRRYVQGQPAVLWPHSCHFNKRDENDDEDQDQDQDQDQLVDVSRALILVAEC